MRAYQTPPHRFDPTRAATSQRVTAVPDAGLGSSRFGFPHRTRTAPLRLEDHVLEHVLAPDVVDEDDGQVEISAGNERLIEKANGGERAERGSFDHDGLAVE